MKWITRERPKIDRIACPWLIKKFIDHTAEFIYVPFDEVIEKAMELDAIPFDIPKVELTHFEGECTFDCIIKKYQLNDPALEIMAKIVRGADTDQHDLAPEAAGLWAISAGLSHNILDDYELLDKGMLIYEALYSWAKNLQYQKHLQSPFEHLLIEVFQKVLKPNVNKKTPEWVSDLKEIIQDQIDTNLTLNLTEISNELNVNPSYLSREFSKYFEDLSFGEYIRKLRVEKAIQLLHQSNYSLTEIAFLTGFSDQSHFTRIFKKHTGKSPSEFKKTIPKK
ncbi:chromate resistance protein ChrB domain-containing protein [Emticicia sp. SJ17W-69]|uniref:chromate resistance protein ChrB domain-containing protein n=1 Tax=Emticicia sp. SJ17W-69 TaxID=3421657 RepID=UPI003EBABD3B